MLFEYLYSAQAFGIMNARSKEEINAALGTNTKGLYAVAQHERENGKPILAGRGGYFLPDISTDAGREELEANTKQLRAKGLSMIRTADAMHKGYIKLLAAGVRHER